MTNLSDMHAEMVRQISEDRNREMAELMAEKRAAARAADEREKSTVKQLAAAGFDPAKVAGVDAEFAAQAKKELEEIEARMNAQSQEARYSAEIDTRTAMLTTDATMLTPAWVGAFSDDASDDPLTEASDISSQLVIGGGACKDYYNWASGAGSGLAGTGVGKIQSWIDFGFWFKPTQSRFYSIRPLFRFRGYYIVRADDGIFTSKFARVTVSAWTNVHQYNWKGWNHVDVLNVGDDNINVNKRFDTDRTTYNSYLLGANDWAYIRCTIGLWAYARGSGSYAKNDFATGNANYLCVPQVHVI
ncbi:MAG: hypothetical protein R3D45_13605 [Rhizobiaceae bacterium]